MPEICVAWYDNSHIFTLRAFPGKRAWVGWSGTEFFASWCWGSESFSFLGPGGEAYFNFLGVGVVVDIIYYRWVKFTSSLNTFFLRKNDYRRQHLW